MWNPPGVIGVYQRWRTVSSMLCALHFCEGILCNSACSSVASASAIVLFPTPDGPTKSQAPDAGRFRNAESTFLGRSSPMKCMGFWLNQNVNYCTASNLSTTLNQIVNSVNSYKNDPGVLVWDIGNEVILQSQNYFSGTTLQNDRVCYAQFVNQISQAIHAADPDHPTTSTDAWTGAWPYYASYSPDLDMLAVNSYGGICSVQSAWAAGPNNNGVSYAKPYIVTEFGPSVEWEVPNDSNGVPTEPTDLQKAAAYPNGWACITVSNANW